jgi:hypothetical protein
VARESNVEPHAKPVNRARFFRTRTWFFAHSSSFKCLRHRSSSSPRWNPDIASSVWARSVQQLNAMPVNRQHRVDYWRSLAAEVLDAAVQAADSQARATLTSIAALYEELAIKAELQQPKHRGSSTDPMPNSTEPRMD